jgi:plasmid stabilization system protein ParE
VTLPFSFHPATPGETHHEYRWYERQSAELGQRFVDEVNRVLKLIQANPARYGFADGDVREAPLRRFPFAVYYRVLPDRIRVLAVYHTARDPSGWQSRV